MSGTVISTARFVSSTSATQQLHDLLALAHAEVGGRIVDAAAAAARARSRGRSRRARARRRRGCPSAGRRTRSMPTRAERRSHARSRAALAVLDQQRQGDVVEHRAARCSVRLARTQPISLAHQPRVRSPRRAARGPRRRSARCPRPASPGRPRSCSSVVLPAPRLPHTADELAGVDLERRARAGRVPRTNPASSSC